MWAASGTRLVSTARCTVTSVPRPRHSPVTLEPPPRGVATQGQPRLRTCRRKTVQLCVASLPGDQMILTGDPW